MLELPLSLLKSLAGPLTIQSGPLTLQSGQFLYLDGSISGNPSFAGIKYNSGNVRLEIAAVTVNLGFGGGSGAVNQPQFNAAATGVAPAYSVVGLDSDISLALTPKGKGGLRVPTGANGIAGVSGAMTAGSVTVNTGAVTASSVIMLTRATAGGTVGSLAAAPASIVAGASFVITSSSGTDTSTVFWLIIN